MLHMRIDPKRLQQQLLHAIAMHHKAATRVQRATTILRKWQRARNRIEKRIGEAEVQRILNADEAVREMTQKKNTVRRTVDRLSQS